MGKRWIIFYILLFFLPLQMPGQVQAKDNKDKTIQGVSAYCMDDSLFAFINLGEAYEIPSIKATATMDHTLTGKDSVPVTLEESDVVVRYLFMIDQSGSMKEYAKEINQFVKSLMDNERHQAVYSVATFGDCFTVVTENQMDKDAVIRTLSKLNYKESLTNPYSGIKNALDYLKICERKNGDIVNLIMISDGQPDLGFSNNEEEKAARKKESGKSRKKIISSPETVVHSVIFSKKDNQAFDFLKKGSGIMQTINGNLSGEKAGKKIASFVDGLYYLKFPLPENGTEESAPVELKLQGSLKDGQFASLEVSWDQVSWLNASSFGEKAAPQKDDRNDTGDKEEMPVQENQDKMESGSEGHKLYLIAGCCGIVAILIIVLVIWRKKSQAGKGTEESGLAKDTVYMKLQIISGQHQGMEKEFYFTEQLLAGSGTECDLVFEEKSVSTHHSRIYRKGKMIYIEDMGSKNGTFLNGMRIHAPNRLRSGDEIKLGSISFLLRF